MSRVQDLKGKAKESVGSVTGNEDLRNKARPTRARQPLKGADEKVKDAASHVKDAVKVR